MLIWGMWFCFKICNVLVVYNESKFISWVIYNVMFVISFFMVVRLEFLCFFMIFEFKMEVF